MASSSMPPPPSTLAHRRTRPNFSGKDLSPCLPFKMSLSKGATFHVSSSPSADADPVLSIPHLTRRSPTSSHAALVSLLSERRDLAAQTIADFEQTFSGARGHGTSLRRRSAESFDKKLQHVRPSLPTDEGIGSSIGSPVSERGISKSLERVELASDKDSGLGESIAGSVVDARGGVVTTEDEAVAANLIQETDNTDKPETEKRQSGNNRRAHQGSRTIASDLPSSRTTSSHPPLSRFAKRKIIELIFNPILKEAKFKTFHPLVNSLAKRTSKNVRCLRDLENSLIYQPLTLSTTPQLYRSFGELTVQLTVDTYQHLSESDQRRATDQPYTNGYFLDLVQQVTQLASQIGTSSRTIQEEEEEEEEGEDADQDAPTVEDEVTLEGGISTTGQIAELVRWRNGKGFSLRTGLPYEPTPGVKRQHSSMTPEEIDRSMARPRKGVQPEVKSLRCDEEGCGKIFTRECDRTKHLKTHVRPYKCPHPSCRFHKQGLPTEKELERHENDIHAANPKMYECPFAGCSFASKRESNCKQHMEKKHNWQYKRSKGKGKDVESTPAQTPRTPASNYSPAVNVQRSPAIMSHHNFDDASSVSGSVVGSTMITPYNEPINNFEPNQFSNPIFPRHQNQFVETNNELGFQAPVFGSSLDQFNGYVSPANSNVRMTPATPAYSIITDQSAYSNACNYTTALSAPTAFRDGLPTPESATHHSYSRHPSVQYNSPLTMEHSLSHTPAMDVPSYNDHMLDLDMEMDGMGLPTEDFALFNNAFTNASAADQVLFGNDDTYNQDYEVKDFERIQNHMDIDLEADPLNDWVDFNQ